MASWALIVNLSSRIARSPPSSDSVGERELPRFHSNVGGLSLPLFRALSRRLRRPAVRREFLGAGRQALAVGLALTALDSDPARLQRLRLRETYREHAVPEAGLHIFVVDRRLDRQHEEER